MKNVKPLGRRMVVLHPKGERKMASGLYRGWDWRDSRHGPQWVWVVETGPECSFGFKRGDKLLVEDGLVLFEEDLGLWVGLKEDPQFSEIAALQEKTECEVETKVMLEGAALAIDCP